MNCADIASATQVVVCLHPALPVSTLFCFTAKPVDLKVSQIGKTFSLDEIEASLKEHKPTALFLCQVGASSMGGPDLC